MESLHSHETSFAGLFNLIEASEPVIARIEIPMIQRDFAQGRVNDEVDVVRRNFLRTLHSAAIGRERISLDFVYGAVNEERTLHPLDGQQRLTTLFLLHWVIATRTDRIDAGAKWTRFTYETRPSAREFCRQLVTAALQTGDGRPSGWIRDQPWFLPTWEYDPTIQSMLVVIDDLNILFRSEDLNEVWTNLTGEQPTIVFHLLPIEQMGAPEALYIRMNSRGRPLTEFENVKAVLEKCVDGSTVSEQRDLAGKLDGAWLDLLWPLRDDDHKVDKQFLNYLRFIVELCELRRDDPGAATLPLLERIDRAFTTGTDGADDNVAFLIDAFDIWIRSDLTPAIPEDVAACFSALFATEVPSAKEVGNRVRIFTQDDTSNLFEICCRHYDNPQRFSVRLKLLLYAVVLHRIHVTPDFSRRLRVVRNLVEASGDERRPERLVMQIEDVRRIIVDGDVEGVTGLNQVQRLDELQKQAFLAQHADLETPMHRLEDHDLLRGSLVAFPLDPARLQARAVAFEQAMAPGKSMVPLTGAMLAIDDYHRTIGYGPAFHFGAPLPTTWWRQLLTGDSRKALAPLATTLSTVLDRLAETNGRAEQDVLEAIRTEWLDTQAPWEGLDWRYYMVKYSAMRSGRSGVFRSTPEGQLGYTLWMLDRENMRGRLCDPFLKAIHELSGVGDAADLGYYELTLKTSETQVRSVPTGFAITEPVLDAHRTTFEGIRHERDLVVNDTSDELLLVIPQREIDGFRLDTVDRVAQGAELLQSLVGAGL